MEQPLLLMGGVTARWSHDPEAMLDGLHETRRVVVHGALRAIGARSEEATYVPPRAKPLIPLPGEFLDRAPDLRRVEDPRLDADPIGKTGLIADAMLDPLTGRPFEGAGAHAALAESEATYARLEAAGDYAPETFDAWKGRFGFPARGAEESLEAWRRRAAVIVYYNLNELGLGRELGCAEFADHDADGSPATGVACFVTNYGATFDNRDDSFADAVRGGPVRNTVCIAYIPSLPEGAQVQFFVYGATGDRQTWAQLDHLGPRPHPFVCTNCHGGTHDPETHLTRDARFLPTQPYNLWFGPDEPYDRASQEEAIRRANALAFGPGATGSSDQKLTVPQREWLGGLYAHGGADIHTPGQPIRASWVPPAWTASVRDAAYYEKIIDPYCMTCHGAVDDSDDGPLADPEVTRSWIAMKVCGDFSMPNAQQTSHRLWRAAGPVEIAGARHDTPADALLAWAGLDRLWCPGLEDEAGCVREGVAQHRLCGNDHSGTVCLPDASCGPALDGIDASREHAGILGYCEMEGARRCPSGSVCVPLERTSVDGWDDGACMACGHPGWPACP